MTVDTVSWTKTTPVDLTGFQLRLVVSHTLRANQVPRSRTIKFRLIKLHHPTTTSAGWTERNGTTAWERNHFTTVLQSECNCGGHWLDLRCFVQLLRCWCMHGLAFKRGYMQLTWPKHLSEIRTKTYCNPLTSKKIQPSIIDGSPELPILEPKLTPSNHCIKSYPLPGRRHRTGTGDKS